MSSVLTWSWASQFTFLSLNFYISTIETSHSSQDYYKDHTVICSVRSPWIATCQASLSIINFQSLLKLMSIKSVMPSNPLILCHPFLLLPSIFPASGSFPVSQFFTSSSQSTGVSALASVLPMNIQV